jgi:RNA polymerase sigma-70 factor (ECF subfamily)
MTGQSSSEVTQLLHAWCGGDQQALEALMPLVYGELHRLAHRYMLRERAGHTLQTTALVNETYLKLVDSGRVRWQDRAHFFAMSACLMRRILVDFARTRDSRKRGGYVRKVELDESRVALPGRNTDLIALDNALNSLAAIDPRQAKIVELRFFSGLGVEETAEVLGISPRTTKREWAVAKLWLLREMKHGGEP